MNYFLKECHLLAIQQSANHNFLNFWRSASQLTSHNFAISTNCMFDSTYFLLIFMRRVEDFWISTQNLVKFAFFQKNATNFRRRKEGRKQRNNIITIFFKQTAILIVNNKFVRGKKINSNNRKSQIIFIKAPRMIAIRTKINIKHFFIICLNFIRINVIKRNKALCYRDCDTCRGWLLE